MTYSAHRGVNSSMTPRQTSWIPALVGALAMMTAGPAAWAGPLNTTTALNINPTNPVSGAVISMQATIQASGVNVPGGTVTFSDSFNGVIEPLGTVQVQSSNGTTGVALFQTEIGGPGVHQLSATFNGTSAYNASTTSQSFTFTGSYLSATAFSSTASSPYTLTGTVSAFGPSTPTGSVTFTDTTANATVGTATLNASTLKTGFTPYKLYPLSSLNSGSSGNTVQPAIGDFNGDGRPDYAVPANGGTVNILLGKGDGTFTTGTAITTTSPFAPCSVVVGDFDGDGDQDIAVLSAQGIGSVNIYLGNGDGTFQAVRNFTVAASTSSSRSLAVGDFNRDGIQDLAVTNYGLSQVAILKGNGDGSFQAPLYNTVNPLPYNLVVGDINQDGFLDIAVSSYGSKYVSILTGNGDGTFKTFTTAYTGSNQVGAVALGDFNGDGWPDLATSSAPDSSVYLLINKKLASPTFAAALPYTVGTSPFSLTVGDFNRDGFLDVVTANNSNATVSVFLGTGAGTLGAATAYAAGGNAIYASVGDMNGDDGVDVAAVTPTGLSVLLAGKTESAALSSVINGCGTQSVTATYAGDSNYATSTSSALTFTPTTAATTLSLSLLPPNAAAGSQVVLQATLAPYNYGSTTTNGEPVTFYNGGTSIGTAALSSGVASLNYTMPTLPYSFQAKYTADCAFQASSSSTLTGTAKLASTINWPTPAAISYGTALSATQLNATDNAVGGGTFVYSPAAGTKLNAGTNTLTVVFTPTNTAYGQESASVQITVNPAQTYITWPPPAPISYGTPLSSFQLDAYATLGTTNVNLSSYYNVTGIYPQGTYFAGGFDNDNYSYSTATLGSTLAWNGLTFNLGPASSPDAVDNVTIALPAGNFAGLFMLGAMVNNVTPPFTFTVNYTDGTNTTASLYMSDWVNAAGYSDESVISCAQNRNFGYNATTQVDSICVYGYSITLDPTKVPMNVVLPNTRNIVMLSMDLTTPQIPGTYVYTPPAGTIEPVGTQTLSVAFTPTSSNYTTCTGTVPLVVGPPVTPIVTTTISWPTPAPITYGTPLSATQLDAVATGASRPTPAGLTNTSVLSTSTDGVSYGLGGFDGSGNTYSYNSLNNGSVNYAGATFTLGSPDTPNAITNGAVFTLPTPGNYASVYLIGAAHNTGNTNVPFTLTYQDSNGLVTDTINMSAWYASAGYAGETIVAATTYADNQSGGRANGNVDLYGYQLPADPTRTLVSVTLPATRNVVIMGIGFGTNQQITVPGTYTYNPAAPTVEPAGTDTLNVSFVPTNTAAYTSATGSTTLVVGKQKPTIIWNNPAPVVVGTALSGTQLNAVAQNAAGGSVAGNFVYNPAAPTVLRPAGTYTLNTTFTPTDTADYTTATASVQIIVGTNGNSTLGGATPYTDCCFFAQPTPYTITVGGVNGITPTGTVGVVFNGNLIGSGSLVTTTAPNAAVTLLLNSGLFYPGSNTVSLVYSGDPNYTTATNTTTIPLLNTAITVNASSVSIATNTTIHYQFAQAGYITYNFNPVGASSSEFTDTGTGTCKSGALYNEAAGFDCTFIVAFKPLLPGTRKGVLQVNFMNSLGGQSQSEPTLNLFLSGTSSAAQIALSSATQSTLNTAVNQPQNLVFNPTDSASATLYVANGLAAAIDTLSSKGGNLTQWNPVNTTALKYPADLTFDAFDDLVVADASTASIYSYSPATMASTTLSTGSSIQLGEPTQARFDLGGYLYISDSGNTPQIVVVPEEAYQPATLNLRSQSVSFPQALAVDNTGSNLYIADGNLNQVLKAVLNGIGGTTAVSQLAIAPCDATVTSCAFNAPTAFAFSPNGDMYVTDNGHRVLKIPSTHVTSSTPTTLVPFTGLLNPTGITLDGSGNIYVTDATGFVAKLAVTAGAMKLPSVGASLTTTVTNTGNLPLNISAVSLGNGTNSSFTETDTCKSALVAVGGTCTITVKYATAAKGFDTLTITSNAFSATAAAIALTY